jgi:hypothetical protein
MRINLLPPFGGGFEGEDLNNSNLNIQQLSIGGIPWAIAPQG